MDMHRGLVAAGLALSTLFAGGRAATALEIVDASKAPAWYATEVVQTDKDGKPAKTVVLGTSPIAFSPHDFDRILSAYGASITDGKALPSAYGTEVVTVDKDGKEIRSIAFSALPFGASPAHVDAVLAAYGLRVVDGARLPENYGREVVATDKEGRRPGRSSSPPLPRPPTPSTGTRCSRRTAAEVVRVADAWLPVDRSVARRDDRCQGRGRIVRGVGGSRGFFSPRAARRRRRRRAARSRRSSEGACSRRRRRRSSPTASC